MFVETLQSIKLGLLALLISGESMESIEEPMSRMVSWQSAPRSSKTIEQLALFLGMTSSGGCASNLLNGDDDFVELNQGVEMICLYVSRLATR